MAIQRKGEGIIFLAGVDRAFFPFKKTCFFYRPVGDEVPIFMALRAGIKDLLDQGLASSQQMRLLEESLISNEAAISWLRNFADKFSLDSDSAVAAFEAYQRGEGVEEVEKAAALAYRKVAAPIRLRWIKRKMQEAV